MFTPSWATSALPIVFDSEPKNNIEAIDIQIPSKDKTLTDNAASDSAANTSNLASPARKNTLPDESDPAEEILPATSTLDAPKSNVDKTAKSEVKPEAKAESKSDIKSEVKPEVKPDGWIARHEHLWQILETEEEALDAYGMCSDWQIKPVWIRDQPEEFFPKEFYDDCERVCRAIGTIDHDQWKNLDAAERVLLRLSKVQMILPPPDLEKEK